MARSTQAPGALATLLAEHDLRNPESATGITADSLTVSVSHSHSSPFYSSTTWGAWAFQDVFDLRFFEFIARRMADRRRGGRPDRHQQAQPREPGDLRRGGAAARRLGAGRDRGDDHDGAASAARSRRGRRRARRSR